MLVGADGADGDDLFAGGVGRLHRVVALGAEGGDQLVGVAGVGERADLDVEGAGALALGGALGRVGVGELLLDGGEGGVGLGELAEALAAEAGAVIPPAATAASIKAARVVAIVFFIWGVSLSRDRPSTPSGTDTAGCSPLRGPQRPP